ncbi:hypothetical protein MITS9509_03396 [Synechococcus sp. MIT S9509]|uniref:hypothetical protein n=1 Tax=unclassified Synechococcus TaxID=2626047 RepID=UPI0007BBEA2A|nr:MULTISPECIES: hypothetical protein [unclassified Synechococcus]KZR82609.1 hypothetical protein MITS9504_03457 [Synechococcus sp. MIT S9504]KZR87556.1 hypothetical protein MITS9509_03396 [Synechococcus sp. MIT S9509]
MSTHADKSHHLSVDGGCIRTYIYLDHDDLRLIVQCLRDEAVRMSRSTDSQCWALMDEREQQCNRLISEILTAGFKLEERVALRGMGVTA